MNPGDEHPTMAHERTVHRYGDYPALFWDLRPDEEVDGTNPAIIARLLEHAPPDTIRALVPADVLLRDFERLDLPEHTRRFWSVVVRMMRERRGLPAPDVPRNDEHRAIPDPPRLAPLPDDEPDLPAHQYREFPELFWDLHGEVEIDRRNPAIIARVLTDGGLDAVRKIVPRQVLLRQFEELELPGHARRFWSVVVEMMRNEQGHSERGQAA